jgi:hypothetical protein
MTGVIRATGPFIDGIKTGTYDVKDMQPGP